jgi:hypothetical protein
MGEDADRIEATARMLEASAQEAHMFASGDGRVSEADAATLLGYAPNYLRQLRSEGKGPPAYSLGLNGCRVSYRFVDIAQWIEARRDFFDE